MEVKIKRVIDHIPKWNDNKKDKNPIVFHLRYLSTSEVDDCMEIGPSRYDPITKKVTGGEIVHHNKLMFLNSVLSIDNLTVNDGDETVKVTTAKELLKQPGLDVLYYEMIAFIAIMNARLDVKN